MLCRLKRLGPSLGAYIAFIIHRLSQLVLSIDLSVGAQRIIGTAADTKKAMQQRESPDLWSN